MNTKLILRITIGVLSVALLVVSFVLGRSCTPHPIEVPQDEENKEFENKIQNHEDKIFKDSVTITYSDRKYRDSIRDILNPE